MNSSRNSYSPLTTQATRRIRWILVVQVIWLALALVLMGWWGWLLLAKNQEMLTLHQALGDSMDSLHRAGVRTQRMLFWEGLFFLGLLTSIGGFLFVLYWRDSVRQRGIQTFFASMTHELRTPLTSIRLQAESIQDQTSTPGTEKVARLASRLLEDAQRLESQVERTLELARLEGGGPIFTQSMFLGPWLERAVDSAREAYGTRIQIDRATGETQTSIEADPSALQVVFRNIIENSVRHSKTEPVIVRVSVEKSDGSHVTIQISDRGQGASVTSQHRGKLGQIFEKGAGSSGAGVGLYLVRSLMERMQGSAVFSPDSTGFTVKLKLPISTEAK